MNVAINAVFILKENILFIEEWIDYHLSIGFNSFYLYDNSKVNKVTGWDTKHSKTIIFGKTNKHNINYDELVDMDEDQVHEKINSIQDKYKPHVNIVEWSPTDDDGNILYKQEQAYMDCLNRMKQDKIDWCATIDMDEFIVLKEDISIDTFLTQMGSNYTGVKLSQYKFSSRFKNLDKKVLDITDHVPGYIGQSSKHIYKVSETTEPTVHTIKTNGDIYSNINTIWFNHYNYNKCDGTIILKNINRQYS